MRVMKLVYLKGYGLIRSPFFIVFERDFFHISYN